MPFLKTALRSQPAESRIAPIDPLLFFCDKLTGASFALISVSVKRPWQGTWNKCARSQLIHHAARIGRPLRNTGKARESQPSTLRRSFMEHSIVNRMRLATALTGIVLAFAAFVRAGAVGTSASQKPQKAKKGTLNITVAADVGGITLEPGEYEVKQVNSAAGPVVRFTRYTYNPYAQEGLSVHQWDEAGEVRVTLQSLDSKAARTKLLAESNSGKPVGLQIRGNSFQYLFVTA
jgi:hypothetical protein